MFGIACGSWYDLDKSFMIIWSNPESRLHLSGSDVPSRMLLPRLFDY